MILSDLYYKFMRPAIVAITAAAITGVMIYVIGQGLLHFHDAEASKEIERHDLWLGTGLVFAILGIAYLLSRPKEGALGPLDEEVAIGSVPMFDLPRSEADLQALRGPEGSIGDIRPGYVLYARSGPLATVKEVLKTTEDFNSQVRTLIYARGLSGAEDEMWIPVEAVSTVYPETLSAILAIRGDEMETLGWTNPPASWVRKEQPLETPLY